MTPRRTWRSGFAVAVAIFPLLAGCGGSGGSGSDDGRAGDAASTTALPTVHVDPSEAAAHTGAPASVGEFCAPYVEMRQRLRSIDYSGDDDAIAAEMAPVMRAWAQQVPGLRRPPGIADEVWDGLQLLAKRILRLPGRPTHRQLAGIEGDLSRDEQRLITAASDWFAAHCDLEAGVATGEVRGRTATRRSR